MTDHFAILGQPRRPWLEPGELKEAFHRLGASLHPDVPGTGDSARFAALNAAYAVLREPASCLRHLLELGGGAGSPAAAAPPADLGDLFMQLAGARRRLDEHLAKRNAAGSPLTRAMLAGEVAALRRDFAVLEATLAAAESAGLQEVRRIDAAWPEGDRAVLAGLADRLAYLGRWAAQVREAQFALAGGLA